jgi:hypothetical protein
MREEATRTKERIHQPVRYRHQHLSPHAQYQFEQGHGDQVVLFFAEKDY